MVADVHSSRPGANLVKDVDGNGGRPVRGPLSRASLATLPGARGMMHGFWRVVSDPRSMPVEAEEDVRQMRGEDVTERDVVEFG